MPLYVVIAAYRELRRGIVDRPRSSAQNPSDRCGSDVPDAMRHRARSRRESQTVKACEQTRGTVKSLRWNDLLLATYRCAMP